MPIRYSLAVSCRGAKGSCRHNNKNNGNPALYEIVSRKLSSLSSLPIFYPVGSFVIVGCGAASHPTRARSALVIIGAPTLIRAFHTKIPFPLLRHSYRVLVTSYRTELETPDRDVNLEGGIRIVPSQSFVSH